MYAVVWVCKGVVNGCGSVAHCCCCCLVKRIYFKPESISGFCVWYYECFSKKVWQSLVIFISHQQLIVLLICLTFVSRFSARSWLSMLLFLQSLKADHVTKRTPSNTCHIWLRTSLVHKVLRMSWRELNAKQRGPYTSIARVGPKEITVTPASTPSSVATITRRQFARLRTRAVDEQSQSVAMPSVNPAMTKLSVSTFVVR